MKRLFFFFCLLSYTLSFAQRKQLHQVYIVEGTVADRETMRPLPNAIIHNDLLSITATSDEDGYFRIVVPLAVADTNESVHLEINKTGYKRNGSGFSFNPAKTNHAVEKGDTSLVWNFDLKVFLLAKTSSKLQSTSAGTSPIKDGMYGTAATKRAFQKFAVSHLREQKVQQQKKGNELVYFAVDGKTVITTATSDIYLDNLNPVVLLDGKRVKLSDVNKLSKRSKLRVDWDKTFELEKKYKKDPISLVTITDQPKPAWGQPEFTDSGRTIANLVTNYQCATVEFENWEDDDSTDNELTVCLINSTKVPRARGDEPYKTFTEIASQIKKALKHPERYENFYIIFVEEVQHTIPLLSSRGHKSGGKVSAADL